MLLTAAMIVKNEEKYLEACIKSLCCLIPEIRIVIVDTGSTDDTLKIAKKYTSFVYEDPWQNDFAYHRNKSFSYCETDWIMQIDADEQLCFQNNGSPEKLINFLKNVPVEVNAIGMPLKDWRESEKKYSAEFDAVKIFRRNKVKWKRKVHNEAIYEGDAAYFPFCFIKHYGYDLNIEQKHQKAKRTITLLNEAIAEDPTDYDSYFYLAQAYSSWLDDQEKTLEYAVKYTDFKALMGVRFNPSIYHLIVSIFMKRKDYNSALKWINEGLLHNEKNIDICYDLLSLGLAENDANKVAIGAQKFVVALEAFQKNRLKAGGQFFFSNTAAHYCLALHYLSTALFERAHIEYQKLKHVLPQCEASLQTEVKAKFKQFVNSLGWSEASESPIILPGQSLKGQL